MSGVNAKDGWSVLYGWAATAAPGAGTCEEVRVTDAEPTVAPRLRPPPAPTIARPTRLGKLKVLAAPPRRTSKDTRQGGGCWRRKGLSVAVESVSRHKGAGEIIDKAERRPLSLLRLFHPGKSPDRRDQG